MLFSLPLSSFSLQLFLITQVILLALKTHVSPRKKSLLTEIIKSWSFARKKSLILVSRERIEQKARDSEGEWRSVSPFKSL